LSERKRETEKKGKEDLWGGESISHYQKEIKKERGQRMLSKKDRKIKSRKIKRAGTKYTQMGK